MPFLFFYCSCLNSGAGGEQLLRGHREKVTLKAHRKLRASFLTHSYCPSLFCYHCDQHPDPKQHEAERLSCLYASTIVHHQGKLDKALKQGKILKVPMQRPWRNTACSAFFLILSRITCLGVVCLPVGWAPSHPSLIKKMPTSLPTAMLIEWSHFPNWSPPLPKCR